ncbi:MAG: ParB/RepB/Spo0J family partition protein [Oscillospiraceae bacterium]
MWRSGCFFAPRRQNRKGKGVCWAKNQKRRRKWCCWNWIPSSPRPFRPGGILISRNWRAWRRSIVRNGLLQPISVRRLEKEQIRAHCRERRLRAAKLAGLERIPAIITEHDDLSSAVLGLEENTQRQQLNCFEQARGLRGIDPPVGLHPGRGRQAAGDGPAHFGQQAAPCWCSPTPSSSFA